MGEKVEDYPSYIKVRRYLLENIEFSNAWSVAGFILCFGFDGVWSKKYSFLKLWMPSKPPLKPFLVSVNIYGMMLYVWKIMNFQIVYLLYFFVEIFLIKKYSDYNTKYATKKQKYSLNIKTLTMDNGGENNLIHTVIARSKLYNCHPYCSGEKGTLESTHRILRRIIKKGRSIDSYSNEDIKIVVKFVNSYYSKIFRRT